MAPVKIKDIVSFTSQDQKNCVENLCGTGEGGRPWLCSPKDRSGVLRADLQMERATAIGYIDVGDFLQSGVDELWDRVRVTCRQPFNKRAQFGLSFLRIRSPEEGPGDAEEEEGEGGGGQRTPEQQTSRVREWLSSPAVQRTFFGRGVREGSPGVNHTGGATEGGGREGAWLSRAARMVITATQSGRRSLLPSLPSPASPPGPASPSSVPTHTGGVHRDGAQDTCTESEASMRNSEAVHRKKAVRRVKRKPVSRKRPQVHSTPCWKKPKQTACEQSLSSSPPCSPAPPMGSEEPETCCPLCGGYFSPEYLPQHAAFCQGEEPNTELSFTPYSPAHSSGPSHSPAPFVEQEMVPCPLCSFRFPASQIQLHASSCGDPLEPEWSWVD